MFVDRIAGSPAWPEYRDDSGDPEPEEEVGPVSDKTGKDGLSLIDEDAKEADAPPLSQLKRGTDFTRAKSTSSTLSEEVEEPVLSEGEVPPPLDRSKGSTRKRGALHAIESDNRDLSEDAQDMKRKPRKSARLG